MNYDIIKLTDAGSEVASADELRASKQPVLLFFGGLMHLAGHDNGEALHATLRATAGKDVGIFYIQEKQEGSWKKKMYEGMVFETTGAVSDAAKNLAETIFLPGFQSSDDLPAIQSLFSRITLMGYSYGSSLIRQMEQHIHSRFISANIPSTQIDDMMQNVVTADLAPTYSLNASETGFARLAVSYRADTVTQQTDALIRRLGRVLYPPQNLQGACVSIARHDNTIMLTPEIGSSTEREVIVDVNDPSHATVRFELYEEAHSFYMYTNVAETFQEGGKLVTRHPSLPTATLIRSFISDAIQSAAHMLETGELRQGSNLIAEFATKQLSDVRLAAIEQTFRDDEQAFEALVNHAPPNFHPTLTCKPSPIHQMAKKWGKSLGDVKCDSLG